MKKSERGKNVVGGGCEFSGGFVNLCVIRKEISKHFEF